MKAAIITLGLFFAFPYSSFAQKPKTVSRTSPISWILKKKELKSFNFLLDSTDVFNLQIVTRRWSNVRFKSPNGEVIYEERVRQSGNRREGWPKEINLTGTYVVEVENTHPYLNNRINLTAKVTRKEFIYGDTSMVDSLRVPGKIVNVLDAKAQITKANPKNYPVNVEKGDQLELSVIPLNKKTPFLQLKNDKEEVLWSTLPHKKEQRLTVPILSNGTYTLEMQSKAFFGKTNGVIIRRTIPDRYLVPPPVAPDTARVVTEEILYDTIPQIYMDTTIFLGAQRDIINQTSKKISWQFADTTDIVFWGVFFGTGAKFQEKVAALDPLFDQEPYLKVGIADPLSAFGLGFLDVLPKAEMRYISFKASQQIEEKLDPLNGNYGIITESSGEHGLEFKNESLSSGQNLYLKIVVFVKTPVEI